MYPLSTIPVEVLCNLSSQILLRHGVAMWAQEAKTCGIDETGHSSRVRNQVDTLEPGINTQAFIVPSLTCNEVLHTATMAYC